MTPSIPFIDLKAQQDRIRPQIDAAIKRVLDRGAYIMGPEVKELEQKLAEFCGVKHVITCANGTDALQLALMAKKVSVGEAVFVPSFTFAATAEVVALLGTTPFFVDVLPDTYNMDPNSLEVGISKALNLGLKPKGVITVDLFGQPADYDEIQAVADRHDLWIIADAAQSFGAMYKGRRVGNIGDIATTSFFPAKPLGCYGDGGAVFTNDDNLAGIVRSLAVHGKGSEKYDNIRIGVNSRLDTIQAAIILEKLNVFPDEIVARQRLADRYNDALEDLVGTPQVIPDVSSVWAQYTVRLPKGVDRGALMADLKAAGVPTMIYYVKPLHQQEAFNKFPVAGANGLPVSETLARHVLSLPMSGYVDGDSLERIIGKLSNWFNNHQ
ncbi:MAG: DegT/DnrJ/EryC1/StrS aminotransferase family protein [Pseudomonadota bacterium]